jgi:SAM-dependent methyltransferase
MSKSEKYWRELSQKIEHPAQTKNKRPDTSDLEIEFLKRFLNADDEVLDIGSGSGLIINKLYPFVRHITAVEKFEGFTRFIIDVPNILVINADILGFKMRKQFDAVLLFGVTQCFSTDEACMLYEAAFDMTKPGGLIIVRTHCGLFADKTIDGFSEELGTEYFAQYRQVQHEIKLIESVGYHNIEKYDIFPDTLNVWSDTRHFLYVGRK